MKGDDMEWWGYHKEHGWVVLDRNVPCNAPGIKLDLLFLRCSDATIFDAKRETWNPPLFRFAPNYLSHLTPAAAAEATAEFEGVQARWPEFQIEIQRHCREVEERAEAIRVQEEKERKQAAADKKKQAAAAKGV
jgi:hypothetical protein